MIEYSDVVVAFIPKGITSKEQNSALKEAKKRKKICNNKLVLYIYICIYGGNVMLKLTSVKLLDNLYKKFKISNLDDNFTLQKLINRSMDLYVHNDDLLENNK